MMIASKEIRVIFVLCAVGIVQSLQAPVITLPDKLEAEIGTTVRLECIAQGDPAPTVTLYRNGAVVQGQIAASFPPHVSNYGGTLYIFTAVEGSGGPYECRATNGIADANGNTIIKKVINVILKSLSTSTAAATTTQTTSILPSPSTSTTTYTQTNTTTATQATTTTATQATTTTATQATTTTATQATTTTANQATTTTANQATTTTATQATTTTATQATTTTANQATTTTVTRATTTTTTSAASTISLKPTTTSKLPATVKPKPGGGTDVNGSGTTRIVNTLHCTIITSLIVLTFIM